MYLVKHDIPNTYTLELDDGTERCSLVTGKGPELLERLIVRLQRWAAEDGEVLERDDVGLLAAAERIVLEASGQSDLFAGAEVLAPAEAARARVRDKMIKFAAYDALMANYALQWHALCMAKRRRRRHAQVRSYAQEVAATIHDAIDRDSPVDLENPLVY